MRHFMLVVTAAVVGAACVQSGHAQQQGIAWQTDIATAQQIAKQTNRPVLVHFWAPWCQPCMRLERDVFSRPETAQAMNSNFVCVKINTDQATDVARAYNVTTLPTDVVLSADGRLISQMQCPHDANQYIQQISQAAAGYRQLTSQIAGQVASQANRVDQYAGQLGTRVQDSLAGLGAGGVGAPAAVAPTGPALQQPTQNAPAQPPTTGATSSSQGPALSAYSDDRYAEYYQQRQAEAGAPAAPVAPQVTSPVAPMVDNDSRYASPQLPAAQAQTPYIPNPVQPQGPAIGKPNAQQPLVQPQVAAIQLPPGSPPLALDGYCCVLLKDQKKWVAGDRRWGAVHRGRTYLFTGPEEQKKFLESPDAYAPVMSGNDPVMALDSGQSVNGKREHGVFFENRVYLFSDETTLARFYQNPSRYAAEVVQAMR